MKFSNISVPLGVVVLTVVLITGCGKKNETVVTPPPAADAPVAATPNQPAPAPIAPISSAPPDSRLAESQAAINSRDYEKAANNLVAMQQMRLNEQQAAAVAAQMRQLQGSLAGAVANGDPRAKAAAAKLRASATVR